MATSTIKPVTKSGTFHVSCSAGLNIINRSTNLSNGESFPSENFTKCIFMIVSHSTVQNNNTIQTDGENTILINATTAQTLTVRWWYFPVS